MRNCDGKPTTRENEQVKIYRIENHQKTCIHDSKDETASVQAVPEDCKTWWESNKDERIVRIRTSRFEVIIERKEARNLITALNIAAGRADITPK